MNASQEDVIGEKVRERYAGIASEKNTGCNCSPSCCNTRAHSAEDLSGKPGCSGSELGSVPDGSVDVVALQELPLALKDDFEKYAGCVAGT